jgi:signal transduction histidine kinase
MDLVKTASDDRILEDQREFYSDKIDTLTTSFFGLAHNLKNPLTALQGKIQIFGMRHPEFKEETRLLLNQCDAMTNMLAEINMKFKLEQDREVRPVDLNNLIENEIRFISLDLHVKHKIQKELRLAKCLPFVSAIYSDLSLLFNNLIKNAIGAMSKSRTKTITFSTSVDCRDVVVTVEDTGCGIAEEDVPNVFLPFQDFSQNTGEEGGSNQRGRGLGLFTVKQLVQKYNGSIDCESTPDVGTKFTIRLPANADS